MNNRLLSISGKAGSGKDTVADIIRSLTDFHYKKRSFAFKLKYTYRLLTGVPVDDLNNRDTKELYRPDLCAMADKLREWNKNVFINALWADFSSLSAWIITDVRYANEFFSVKGRGGLMIRVERPGIESGDHSSETDIDNFPFDVTIINDGTLDDLREKVKQALITYKVIEDDSRSIEQSN